MLEPASARAGHAASTPAPRWRCPACTRILTADDMPAPPPPPATACRAAGAGRAGCRRGGERRRRAACRRPARLVRPDAAGSGAAARRPRVPRPPPRAPAAGAAAGSRRRRGRRTGRAASAPPIAAPKFALTKEPIYEGEPILAVAADSEELAAAAIEAHRRRLRAAPLRDRSARLPASRRPRTGAPKATSSSAPSRRR